jgi:hypothetical protein
MNSVVFKSGGIQNYFIEVHNLSSSPILIKVNDKVSSQKKTVPPKGLSKITIKQPTCELTVVRPSNANTSIYKVIRDKRQTKSGETWTCSNDLVNGANLGQIGVKDF